MAADQAPRHHLVAVMDRHRWRVRRHEFPLPELSEAAAAVGGWLRQRADGPGLDAALAGGMLRLIGHSAHLLNEVGTGLERAIEPPPPAVRAGRRAPSAGKASSRRPRARKAKPDSSV